MTLNDIILLPIFVVIILLISIIIQEVFYKKNPLKKYFIPALLLKLMPSMLYAAIYAFYYKGGDTLAYHEYAMYIYEVFQHDPKRAFEIATSPANHFSFNTKDVTQHIWFYKSEATYMVVRLAFFFGIICFGSFWVTTLLFATLSFTGLWALYTVLADMYPKLKKQMFIAVFLLPSVFFWGSGLMKDTITIGCLGWLIYAFYQIVIKKRRILSSVFIFMITFRLIWILKAYIVIGVLPALFYWFVRHYANYVKETRLKMSVLILTGVFLASFSYYFQTHIQNLTNVLFLKFADIAFGFQTWHSIFEGQSIYSLGEIDFTISGVLSKFPAAVNVTLFRPYLNEAHNPVMLITSIESTFFLVFTIYVCLRVGFFRLFRFIWSEHFVGFCLIFTLLFGFAVGFTSYNFGALARYKIPCLPFYIAALFIVLQLHKERKNIAV
ncbi:MAG: hypothetical protein ACPG5B_08200 [Chitinophagales bacterium]